MMGEPIPSRRLPPAAGRARRYAGTDFERRARAGRRQGTNFMEWRESTRGGRARSQVRGRMCCRRGTWRTSWECRSALRRLRKGGRRGRFTARENGPAPARQDGPTCGTTSRGGMGLGRRHARGAGQHAVGGGGARRRRRRGTASAPRKLVGWMHARDAGLVGSIFTQRRVKRGRRCARRRAGSSGAAGRRSSGVSAISKGIGQRTAPGSKPGVRRVEQRRALRSRRRGA